MSILVKKPGVLSTLQDDGRWNYQGLGVSVTGAMDPSALRLANCLLGNPLTTTCLEMTLSGSSLVFEDYACIAISGAFLNPHVDQQAIQNNRAYLIQPGQTLSFKPCASSHGARAYLAVHGGFASEPVMGSQSTDIRVGFGGLQGRALQKGDRLYLNRQFVKSGLSPLLRHLQNCRVYLSSGLGIQTRQTIRLLRGTHFQAFTLISQQALVEDAYTITPQSDRMGYRLQGTLLRLEREIQIRSEPTTFGTIQVPTDGQPIALMADRQSMGGYPKIATVIRADLAYLAQHLPGQKIRFGFCTLEEAQLAWAQRLNKLKQLSCQVEESTRLMQQCFVPNEYNHTQAL